MKNNKGFIISTTLYSAFGIMMVTIATILFVLSNRQATMSSMTNKLKLCIEECNTPENICNDYNPPIESFKLYNKLMEGYPPNRDPAGSGILMNMLIIQLR